MQQMSKCNYRNLEVRTLLEINKLKTRHLKRIHFWNTNARAMWIGHGLKKMCWFRHWLEYEVHLNMALLNQCLLLKPFSCILNSSMPLQETLSTTCPFFMVTGCCSLVLLGTQFIVFSLFVLINCKCYGRVMANGTGN